MRKACTESLVEVSKAVGPKLSHELLTEVFMRLAGDSQKVVRNGALQVYILCYIILYYVILFQACVERDPTH